MMNMKTLRAIESLKAEMGGRLFQKREIHGVSYSTLKKYGYIEKVREEEFTEMSMEDAVYMLNAMDGQDCYYDMSEGFTKYVVHDGKMWQVDVSLGYKFIK